MLRRLRFSLLKHFNENIFLYFLVLSVFVIGIVAGSFSIKILNQYQKEELTSYIQGFFTILNIEKIDNWLLFKNSLFSNLKTIFLLWVFGVTVIGIPFILGVLAIRGYILGFTVGFFISEFGFRGLILSISAILPQNVIMVPALMIIGVISLNFSLTVFRRKKITISDFLRLFLVYTMIIYLLSLFIVIGCFVESYINPVFLKVISTYAK